MSNKKRLLIATAVWGNWHISKLLDLNLPTLLAQGNFPALARSCELTYVIYTSAADLARLRGAAVVQRLSALMRLEFRTISAAALAAPIEAHHEYWADATERAKREGAFVLLMPPDVAWSDGSFAHVGGLLAEGKKAIFMTYLRSESESFTSALLGRRMVGALPISVSGGQLVEIAMRTLHPLMAAYLRSSEHFPIHPEMMLWAVRGQGLACRILAREMFVYDPALVKLNQSNLLESDMDPSLMHVIEDSDDLFAVSLAPLDKEYAWYRWPRRADPDEVADWWLGYDSWINDRLVSSKLRWHIFPVDEAAWRATESSADLFLRRASILREARYLWRSARSHACTMSARILAVAAATGALTSAARGRGGAIVFLPVNSAFEVFPSEALEYLLSDAGRAELVSLLRAHHIPNDSTVPLSALEALLKRVAGGGIFSADGAQLQVDRCDGSIRVNQANVIGGPLRVGKQTVYLVDCVLMSPEDIERITTVAQGLDFGSRAASSATRMAAVPV